MGLRGADASCRVQPPPPMSFTRISALGLLLGTSLSSALVIRDANDSSNAGEILRVPLTNNNDQSYSVCYFQPGSRSKLTSAQRFQYRWVHHSRKFKWQYRSVKPSSSLQPRTTILLDCQFCMLYVRWMSRSNISAKLASIHRSPQVTSQETLLQPWLTIADKQQQPTSLENLVRFLALVMMHRVNFFPLSPSVAIAHV